MLVVLAWRGSRGSSLWCWRSLVVLLVVLMQTSVKVQSFPTRTDPRLEEMKPPFIMEVMEQSDPGDLHQGPDLHQGLDDVQVHQEGHQQAGDLHQGLDDVQGDLHQGPDLQDGAELHQSLQELQIQNQLQTLTSTSPQRGSSPHQGVLGALLPRPQPEEDPQAFVLDLRNFPDLANADMGAQNPNIQVTIEVVDSTQLTETEMEMDLTEEGEGLSGGRNDWSATTSSSSSDWGASGGLDHRKLFWPLFWEYPDPPDHKGATTQEEETNGLGGGAGGAGGASLEEEEEDYTYDPPAQGEGPVAPRWNDEESYDFEEAWSEWSPCSVTCGRHGNQKRTRSCGYACSASESRSCDLAPCHGDIVTVTELPPVQTTNSTHPLVDTSVDSCEKWLSCKDAFLGQYLEQVLTELPGCPCLYPSEAVYGSVVLEDPPLGRPYRWRDASSPRERLDIYKPSARFCLRSMLSRDSPTLAAQHCCYDARLKLITRGKGAGAPDLISTEFSPELHYKVDVLPWILCKGDWSRFHSVRPPNNGLLCPQNPHNAQEYAEQLREAREY